MRAVIAPEPYLSACLQVLQRAILYTRAHHYEPEIALDVMDAIHNIPPVLGDWQEFADKMIRSDLARCDSKWPTGLLAAYDFILERRVV